jgi:glycosyltransferase involved in cell wall biosynthesis
VASISVVLISFNESERIGECLRCVAWADEIIVVDSESTDDTRAIAAKYTPLVHNIPWAGFGPQKNTAIDLATSDWILSIDCDEYVSGQLADEIASVIKMTDCHGFMIPFRNRFLGRSMRFGEWSGERKLRLFRRGHGRFTDVSLHERLEVDGKVSRLRGWIVHDTCPTSSHLRQKQMHYAGIGAQAAIDRGKRITLWGAAARAGWAFARSYLLKGGVLDGRTGWSLAWVLGQSTWIKYRWVAAGSVPQAYRPRSGVD